MYGILVLCLGYLSYVWDISLMFWDLCLMYVLGTKYLVPSTWYQVLGTKYLVPSTWHQVLGTGTKYFGISAAEGGEPPLGL